MFGAAHGVGRVHGEDVPGHQPVKEHAQGGEMLLDRGRRARALQVFDERGDVDGLNVDELVDAVRVAPGGEAARGAQVGLAGVVVVELGREKLENTRGRSWRRRKRSAVSGRAATGARKAGLEGDVGIRV